MKNEEITGQHQCPQCGLNFTAAVVLDGDVERLELTYDGTGKRPNDDERIAARIDELREQWRREYEAEHAAAVSERPAKKESEFFLL